MLFADFEIVNTPVVDAILELIIPRAETPVVSVNVNVL